MTFISARSLVPVVILTACSCSNDSESTNRVHCSISSNDNPLPTTYDQVVLGMAYDEVAGLLGEPDYSPTDGQYYHATGGDCRIEGRPDAPCGYVMEYRVIVYTDDGIEIDLPEDVKDYRLKSCSWGGIGE